MMKDDKHPSSLSKWKNLEILNPDKYCIKQDKVLGGF